MGVPAFALGPVLGEVVEEERGQAGTSASDEEDHGRLLLKRGVQLCRCYHFSPREWGWGGGRDLWVTWGSSPLWGSGVWESWCSSCSIYRE